MTRKELPARAANLQRAVASTTSCTPATVESLRSFLLPREDAVTQSNKPAAKALVPKTKGSSVRPTGSAGARARKQPVVDVLEISGEVDAQAQIQDRTTLATEVVNATLKALSEAIRKPPSQKRREPFRRTSSNASFSNGVESRSQTPLQPVSVNRIANMPREKGHLRRSSSTIFNDGRLVGIRAQAECSRIAFAYLRSIQGRNASPPMPHLQLESGMSALVGRLITLGFDDLAIKELCILKRRLEGATSSSGQQRPTKHMFPLAREDGVGPKTETLVELLKFSSIKAQGPLLALVITTQMQVLKMLALKREASLTEAALQHLRLEVMHSPANLIQQQIMSESPDSRDKAAHQLETLAQSLITLCPSPSAREDCKLSKSSNDLAPHIAFEYQLLAFRIRSVWWKISGHRTNIATEMINPFARCMANFYRRSKMDGQEKYKLGLSAFEIIADISQTTTGFQEKMFLGVYQVLADMAQESSQYDEASRWVKKSTNSARGCGVSQTQLCILDCRLASLMIRGLGSGSSEHLLESLQAASRSLAGDLQGESAELDVLLTIIASLRKTTFSVIQDAHKQHKTDRVQTPLIVDTCLEIVLLCVKFLLRYLGNGPSQEEDEKTTARRKQRRGLAAHVAYPVIDSIVAVASLSVRATVNEWLTLDKGLRDCWRLALILEGPDFGEKKASGEAKQQSSLHSVSISNAYWYRYLHLKQVSADNERLRDCLRMSIDIIRKRSLCERTAGCLSKKLEKYAQLCENVRDYKKATEIYREVIHTHIEDELLSTAAEAATTRSMPNALEDNGALAPLLRSLVAYPKAALKANEQLCSVYAFYDDSKLCDGERGVLLEQQLIALLHIFQDQGSAPAISQVMTALAQTLLSLYTEKVYPVRRFRVIVRLLAVLSANPHALDDANREQVLREPSAVSAETHQDVHLLGYLPHLTECRDVLINLNNGTLGVEKVEALMANWSRLLHEHPAWISLQLQVYDISDWLSQLEQLADYLEMKGLELTRISVLHVLVTVHEASASTQCLNLVSTLTELGLQYSRVGYSGAAGVVLHKAERYLATSNVPAKLALRFHLVQAEIAHTNGGLKRCSDHLDKARKLFQEDFTSVNNQRLRSKDQSERFQMMGDAAYLLSLLAVAEGHSGKALYLARLCVKSYQKAWAIMERKNQRKTVTARVPRTEVGYDSIVDCLSEVAISECATVETMTEPHSLQSPCGAAFWSIVPRLSRGSIHLSSLFAHHGLLPEARYSLDQAQRIANSVHARALIGQNSALSGQYIIRGGEVKEGLQLLQQAESLLSGIPRGCVYASLQLSFASHYTRHKQWQASHAALDAAETTLEKLMQKGFVDTLVHKQTTLEDLDLQLSTLTLKETRIASKPKIKPRTTAMRKNSMTKPAVHEVVTVSSVEEIPTVEVIALQRVKGEVLLGRTSTALEKGDLESASLLLDESLSDRSDERGIVSQALLSSRLRYSQKLEQLVADPIFCVIPESTISHPSIRVGGDRKRQQVPSQAPIKTLSAAPVKAQRGRTPASKRRPRSPSLCKSETDVLHLARNELTEIVKLARKVSSTETLHKITDALGKILLLLSATFSSASKTAVSPAFVVYTLEIGRILSMARESATIEVERQLSSTKITHQWPDEDAFQYQHTMGVSTALDFATFQAEYIDIIPSSWTTISMTLTESREEMLICKIRAGQSPFILRLPLTRHNPLESDEERFGFDQGRAELQDIVLSANQSTHGAQDLSQKGAKTQWWEARTALDARLKDLLNNIESLWFGGFKSVFSHAIQDSNLLARFQQSLQNILDKHLPSRQKSGRGTQYSRITLDQSVLQLFVGLGDPNESDDVDEPLMDLLYFVVDIMQFNGERNAYDEVDFDSIVIETIDALRHYHQAVKDEVESNEEQHTILVLDKHLHCFPWESLPCLSGQAVSRLPSLRCLRDRILQQKAVSGAQNSSSEAGKLYVNRNSGTSILNPGGDLNATQSRFEEPLQGLPEWETIAQREPTETEMKDCLENHDILLYFGHGSGGQYIRSRTIKKLEKCAVALLMGCSSGALTDAGEFEPYGTPMNYMHAGCPAMLATLWDVTDKDIDKFSNAVLEKWGLFGKAMLPVPSSPQKKSAKQRGKSKVRDVEETKAISRGPVSLDEAVAHARESCLLKYLNGAAPVVYGVPVFLS